jgi:hypothetical protein
MYTQTTVQARNLRKGDAIVGSGETVVRRRTLRGLAVVDVFSPAVKSSYTHFLQLTEDVRVAREVRP